VALKTESLSETYAEMWGRCTRLANALLEREIKKPDLVATYMPNSYQFAEVIVATQMIGLPLTLGNYRLTPEEIIYQINDCEAKVCSYRKPSMPSISSLRDRLATVKEIVLIGDEKAQGVMHYEELIKSGQEEEPDVKVLPDDMHLLFYTSGTTGKPKGAVRTIYSDYNMAISTALELGLNRNDGMFVAAPMYAAATAGYLSAP